MDAGVPANCAEKGEDVVSAPFTERIRDLETERLLCSGANLGPYLVFALVKYIRSVNLY